MRWYLCGTCIALFAIGLAACHSPAALYSGTKEEADVSKLSNDEKQKKHRDHIAAMIEAAEAGEQVVNIPLSRISLEKPSKQGGGGRTTTQPEEGDQAAQLQLVATPTESGDYFRIRGQSGFWSTTNIQVVKVPNTDIASTVNVDFRDDTPARIQSIVGLVSAVTGVPGLSFFTKTVSVDTGVNPGGSDTGNPCSSVKQAPPFSLVVTSELLTVLLADGIHPNGSAVGEKPDAEHLERCWTLYLRAPQPKPAEPQDVVDRKTLVGMLRDGEDVERKYFPHVSCLTLDATVVRYPLTAPIVLPLMYGPGPTTPPGTGQPSQPEIEPGAGDQSPLPDLVPTKERAAAEAEAEKSTTRQIVRIIDPNHLRLVRLPEKGKIEMHASCNANLTNSPSDQYKDYFDAAGAVVGTKPSKQSK